MEAAEVSEFAKEMREAGEASMTRVSLIISVLAVLVAMVTVLSHREHTKAVLSQARASDQWGEYQGRRVRQAQYAFAQDLLTWQPGLNAATQSSKTTQYKGAQQRLQGQLDEDTRKAKNLEAEVERPATTLAKRCCRSQWFLPPSRF